MSDDKAGRADETGTTPLVGKGKPAAADHRPNRRAAGQPAGQKAGEATAGTSGRPFRDLERQIVTDSVDPEHKADFLARRATVRRKRGLDDPSPLTREAIERRAAGDEREPVSAKQVGLVVAYIVVCVVFVGGAWYAVTGFLGTHGQGAPGRATITKCHKGGPFDFGAACTGSFMPTSPAALRHGVVLRDNLAIKTSHVAAAKTEIPTRTLVVRPGTAFASDWNGWIPPGVVALVALALWAYLTFRPGGVAAAARERARDRREQRQRKRERAEALRRGRQARRQRQTQDS